MSGMDGVLPVHAHSFKTKIEPLEREAARHHPIGDGNKPEFQGVWGNEMAPMGW
jgi:hypothetical protein